MQKEFLNKVYLRLNRNKLDQHGEMLKKNTVNLIYWRKHVNLGDTLAPVILDWMLARKSIPIDTPTDKTYALATIGSIIDLGRFDSVIWGSGLQSFESVVNTSKAHYKKMDIRAVRGPFTRQAVLACGYSCPEIYGDPGVLMPLIYTPSKSKSNDKTIIINHYSIDEPQPNDYGEDVEVLSIRTVDYKNFIDTLCTAKKVVSSSLHGIILAESYGIPAVFLCPSLGVEQLKFYDWYYSTDRYSVKIARTAKEAIEMTPMELPDLGSMRNALISAFPYDLWLH